MWQYPDAIAIGRQIALLGVELGIGRTEERQLGHTGMFLILAIGFVFSMFAVRITRAYLTAPMVFLAVGLAFSQANVIDAGQARETLHIVAEIALVLLLFLDAAQIDFKALREHQTWPARMLVFGLPLAVVFGTVANVLIFPEWPLLVCALVAALLAPTDAALGQAVITNPLVPERVRNGITVESGLNDGLALPIILLLASLVAGMSGRSGTDWALFGLQQVALGTVAGLVIGLAGAVLLLFCKRKMLTSATYEGVGAIALAGSAYAFALVLGGNGFISAFVAGLAFGSRVRGRCKFVYEFVESDGQLLVWSAFFLLGLAMLPGAIAALDWRIGLAIMASLLVVRPLAIWLSMTGSQASGLTRLFFGWFGPRGLATALFALLVAAEIGDPWADVVMAIAFNAVWISALLHGVSAAPAAAYYSRHTEGMGECAENRAMPARLDVQES